jgi:hypothetical protein
MATAAAEAVAIPVDEDLKRAAKKVVQDCNQDPQIPCNFSKLN